MNTFVVDASRIFGSAFRLTVAKDERGDPDFTLAVAP